MNFDQGAHNTRGCDDATRQSVLPLLHSLPPDFSYQQCGWGYDRKDGGKKLEGGGGGGCCQLITLATNGR